MMQNVNKINQKKFHYWPGRCEGWGKGGGGEGEGENENELGVIATKTDNKPGVVVHTCNQPGQQ